MFEYLDEFIQDNEDDIIITGGITEDRIQLKLLKMWESAMMISHAY